MRISTIFLLAAVPVALFSVASCDSEEAPGTGHLSFAVWGEEFIEEGIPADEFDDAWSVTFDRFVVFVHDVSAGDGSEGEPRVSGLTGCAAFDLVKPGPTLFGTGEAVAGDYPDTAYAIAPAPSCSSDVGTADADVIAMMVAEGYSVYVTGTATKGDVSKTFQWGFATATDYVECHSEADVPDDGEATIQLTIHGDHFFYDSLTNPEAGLAFETLAQADSNGDDVVAMDELKAFSGTQFQALDNYDVGDSGVDNIYGFLAAQSATLGHIDGEGHCEVR